MKSLSKFSLKAISILPSEKNTRSDKNLENIAKRYAAGQALYKSENRIIEAEYEDVDLDLQKFRENRENEKKQLIEEIVGFEWMYSKKDEKMVKIPSDVADLIKYLQRIKTYR